MLLARSKILIQSCKKATIVDKNGHIIINSCLNGIASKKESKSSLQCLILFLGFYRLMKSCEREKVNDPKKATNFSFC